MKIIQSAGGPLIGFDVDQLSEWSGVLGKKFIGESSQFDTDYDAVRYSANGRHKPPCAVALLDNGGSSVILISMPFETAIIGRDDKTVYIAQVEFADPDWEFTSISHRDFDLATFDEQDRVVFVCKKCTYVLFDSACAGCNVGADCLTFDVAAGEYTLSVAEYRPDERTGLFLYRIRRA